MHYNCELRNFSVVRQYQWRCEGFFYRFSHFYDIEMPSFLLEACLTFKTSWIGMLGDDHRATFFVTLSGYGLAAKMHQVK